MVQETLSTYRQVFREPLDSKLIKISRSIPISVEQLEVKLDQNVKPLVADFAKRLMLEQGLRHDLIVGGQNCDGCNRVDLG